MMFYFLLACGPSDDFCQSSVQEKLLACYGACDALNDGCILTNPPDSGSGSLGSYETVKEACEECIFECDEAERRGEYLPPECDERQLD